MRVSVFSRHVLGICAAAAMLAGCGGSQQLPGSSPAASTRNVTPSGHQRFDYTGQRQTFTVPADVKWLTVVALGASGASGAFLRRTGTEGANGGRVYAVIPVTPGERLAVFVGGEGSEMSGGFNGGGNGGGATYDCYCYGYGGGGASDIRGGGDKLRDRIVVVGGGGGVGGRGIGGSPGDGGKGGRSIGGAGGPGGGGDYAGGGGAGGKQHRGGSGGSGGNASGSFSCSGAPGGTGSRGQGGDGGGGCSGSSSYGAGGGGGGGGYYGAGGGGGGAGCIYCGRPGGGGGGGSSYIEPSAKRYQTWQGWRKATGNGVVILTW